MPQADFEITKQVMTTALDEHNTPFDAVRVYFKTSHGDLGFVDVRASGFTGDRAKQAVAARVAELNKART